MGIINYRGIVMWKKIKGASNYEVNELGEIKSITRTMCSWNGYAYCNKTLEGKKLKFKDIRGYKNVSIVYDDGIRRMKQVHRLVLETFAPIDNQEKLQVNHIDGVKDNNNLSNLEWCTCKENIIHSHKLGLIKRKRDQRGEKNNLSKLTDEKVIKILEMIKNGANNQEIAKLFGVKDNTISNIRRGHTWKHIPR